MRNISFALTTGQFCQRTKTVTRRLGWANLKPGTRLMGVEKGMGLKPGEQIVRLGEIEVVSVRREPLGVMLQDPAYGREECIREGFPNLAPEEFVAMFCRHMVATHLTPVTRIEFKYVAQAVKQ